MMTSIRLRPGDVILSSGTGFFAGLNKLAQRAYTWIPAEFTHVAICVVPDVIFDARPFESIALRNVFREVESGNLVPGDINSRNFWVLRPPIEVADSDSLVDLAVRMIQPMYVHIGKKYNWLFTVPQKSDRNPLNQEAGRVFCSELCSLILRHLSLVPASWGASSTTLPVHFQKLVEDGWQDVSDDWSTELRAIREALANPTSETGRLNAPRIPNADRWILETTNWAKMHSIVSNLDNEIEQLLGRWPGMDSKLD